jgi:hypothetical protein
MIKLRNLIDLLSLVWKSKEKIYLLIHDKGIIEHKDFKTAKAKGIELMRHGDTLQFRIALELSFVKSIIEVKK